MNICISPLDDRYKDKIQNITIYFSEYEIKTFKHGNTVKRDGCRAPKKYAI